MISDRSARSTKLSACRRRSSEAIGGCDFTVETTVTRAPRRCTVVKADALFTASAVLVQPVSGALLAWMIGYRPEESWIVAALALYVMVGLCWLPVVGIQLRLRNIAAEAAGQGAALPPEYFRLFRVWFWLGWPAFTGVIAIFALMLWKPHLW